MTHAQLASLRELQSHHRAHHDAGDFAALLGMPVRIRIPGPDGGWHSRTLLTAAVCEAHADMMQAGYPGQEG